MSQHTRRLFWAGLMAGMLFAGNGAAQETPTDPDQAGAASGAPSQVGEETASAENEADTSAEGEASASLGVSLSAPKGPAASPDGRGRPNHEHFNMHFFGGVGFALGDDLTDLGYDSVGAFGGLGFDYVVAEPLALSFDAGMSGFGHETQSSLRDLHLGAGVRVRLLVDRSGPISEEGGSIAGNLWVDAHFNYHNYNSDHHAGFNVGVGYELALLENFNVGPFARFQMTFAGDDPNYATMFAGLQISIGGRLTTRDKDSDGIDDENDNCPEDAEDKDGFEDEDGCPDNDNDGDGIDDETDKCPGEQGPADNKGCPVEDTDGDGIDDDADKCPDEQGPADKEGCPVKDTDGDGIDDETDKCPGEAEDKDGFEDEDGCPDNDNDGDGIDDETDKCPGEAEDKNGVEDEDGCPESTDEGDAAEEESAE